MDPYDVLEVDRALLAFVLERHPSPVHADELGRAFYRDDWLASVSTLVDDGLLHREGPLHMATRAAVRAEVLLG